jgi:Fur family transcriptional regulator, ferric uptake regulator
LTLLALQLNTISYYYYGVLRMESKGFVRFTSQRRVILDEMSKIDFHPTADDVYDLVKRRLPRISLGTVYRNLDSLADQGIIQKLETCGRQRRYDCNPENHSHVLCTHCGALEDVVMDSLRSFVNSVEEPLGYEIQGVRVEFLGLCPNCREERVLVQRDSSSMNSREEDIFS